MSKLAKEIIVNNAAVTVAADKKAARKALTESMLDRVSGARSRLLCTGVKASDRCLCREVDYLHFSFVERW